MDQTKFTLQDGDKIQALPCLDIVAFSTEMPEKAGAGFERFTRTFADRYGPSFASYRTGDMKRWRKYEPRALDAPYHWFADSKTMAKTLLGFHAHSGTPKGPIVFPSMNLVLMGLWDPRCFYFRVSLDVSAAERADELVALIENALADFPLHSGYCGYSFIWDETDHSAQRAAYAWSAPLYLRYPGFNCANVTQATNAVHEGIVAVSWLTFVGQPLTEQLGGSAALRERLGGDAALIPLPSGGCILRAGPSPELGDTNRCDDLPSYRRIGRLLAPCQASDAALENYYVDMMDEAQAHDWKLRFFR